MANAALNEIVARADAEIAAAQRELLVGGLVMVAAILFSILGFVIVQMRVSGPIQGMTAAMDRLSSGDLEATVPYTDRGAEIGKMAGALQVFKDGMIAREKAEAGADLVQVYSGMVYTGPGIVRDCLSGLR